MNKLDIFYRYYNIRACLALLCFCVWLGVIFIASTPDNDQIKAEWESFKVVHECVITDVNAGHGSSTIWLCNDGVRYWK